MGCQLLDKSNVGRGEPRSKENADEEATEVVSAPKVERDAKLAPNV